MKKFLAFFLMLIFMINSSAVALPLLHKPENPLEKREKLGYVNQKFWMRFNDPYLSQYICLALKNNHDAREASWKVEEYRQNVKYSFGKELPSLSVSADYAGLHIPKLDNFELSQNAFILPFLASYEPDFLLKNRDKTKSVKKEYEATKAEEKAIYIALASDVASNYLNILQYDRLITIQQRIVNIKKEQYRRELRKFNSGIIAKEDLNTSLINLQTQQNNLETMMKNREKILTEFAVLVGMSPSCINDLKRGTIEEFEYNAQIPSSILSDVVFARPDIIAAEARLEKSKIDIRVARKEFLPSFNLTGVWAFNTIAPGSFFSWESSLAAIFAGATQDIFKGGMKLANLKIQKARYEQLFENYHQSALVALKEVNDSLCIIKYDTQVDNNTISQLSLKKDNYKQAQNKYLQGIISYPELLSEEESLLNMQQNQVQTKTMRIMDNFTLYKAVGANL